MFLLNFGFFQCSPSIYCFRMQDTFELGEAGRAPQQQSSEPMKASTSTYSLLNVVGNMARECELFVPNNIECLKRCWNSQPTPPRHYQYQYSNFFSIRSTFLDYIFWSCMQDGTLACIKKPGPYSYKTMQTNSEGHVLFQKLLENLNCARLVRQAVQLFANPKIYAE